MGESKSLWTSKGWGWDDGQKIRALIQSNIICGLKGL